MPGITVPLLSNIVFQGSSSAAGAANGSTVVASAAGQVNNYYRGMTLEITSSPTSSLNGERREIQSYVAGSGTFILDPAFTAQIPSGTTFNVLSDRPGAATDSPIISILGSATAAGTTTTLIDSARTEADNYWNGQVLVMLSGVNAGLSRPIRSNTAGTTTITVDPAFPSATANGDTYAIVSIPQSSPTVDSTGTATFQETLGNKGDTALFAPSATGSAIAYLKGLLGGGTGPSYTKGATAASNFFAGAVNVISLTPAGVSNLGGVKVSIAPFTATATITIRVFATINGTERQLLQWTRIVGTDQPGVIIIDSPDLIDGNGALNSWRVSLQSNNAADTAVAVDYEYFLQRVI